MTHSLYIWKIIRARREDIYVIEVNFLLSHTTFQQNKDCNILILEILINAELSRIRPSSKTRTATTRIPTVLGQRLSSVAYDLPAKQGLQLIITERYLLLGNLSHTTFQQNKDCNISSPRRRTHAVTSRIRPSSKTRTATVASFIISIPLMMSHTTFQQNKDCNYTRRPL